MAAVGDHGGGDGGLGGMVISRGGEITTPLRPTELLPPTVGMQQQRAIAAAHHPEAELDEADGPVAQIMALPGSPGDVWGGEQGGSDVAIAGVLKAAVEGA